MHLIDQMDALTWSYKKSNGSVSAKLTYDCIINASSPPSDNRLLTFVLNSNLPRKVCCFTWLVLKNRLLTRDNLQKQGWMGPGICALCRSDVDSVEHIFYHCSLWKNIFSCLLEQHHLSHSFLSDGLCSFLEMWTVNYSKQSGYCFLPFLSMWAVWKAMNLSIFEGKIVPIISILH